MSSKDEKVYIYISPDGEHNFDDLPREELLKIAKMAVYERDLAWDLRSGEHSGCYKYEKPAWHRRFD